MLCFKNMKSYFKQDYSALPYTENQVYASKWTSDLQVWLELKMFLTQRVTDYTRRNQECLEGYQFLK